MSSADDQYEQQNDVLPRDAPAGDAQDNDYVSRPGQKQGPIPVQSDNAAVEDPIDAATADSDQQLGELIMYFERGLWDYADGRWQREMTRRRLIGRISWSRAQGARSLVVGIGSRVTRRACLVRRMGRARFSCGIAPRDTEGASLVLGSIKNSRGPLSMV